MHYSATVKWNLSLSVPSQWLAWRWKKNALIYFCWSLSFWMWHLGCWLLGWESIKQALLHPWRSRWRSLSSLRSLKHPSQDQHHNWDSVVYLVLSLWFVISLTGIKATDPCSEGSRAICKHPRKTRMSTRWCWEGGRGQLCQQGAGGCGGVCPVCDAALEPHHQGSQVDMGCPGSPGSGLPTGLLFLDASWVPGNYENNLSLTPANRWIAATLLKCVDWGPLKWDICKVSFKCKKP